MQGKVNHEATAANVLAAVREIVTIAKANPESDVAQLYRVTAENLPLFKGFAYRLRKIAETSDTFYLSAIWALRKIKQTSSFRAPYMEALFDVVTGPNPGQEIPPQSGRRRMFDTVAELQDWLIQYAMPRFQNTVNEMRRIAHKGDIDRTIMAVDVELIFPQTTVDKYANDEDKTWVLTAGQLLGMASIFENYMGMMYYASSYNLEVLGELFNTFTMETFLDRNGSGSRVNVWSIFGQRAQLVSPKRIYELASPQPGPNKKGRFGKNSRKGQDYVRFMTIRDRAKKPIHGHSHYLQAARALFTQAVADQIEYHDHQMRLAEALSAEDARQLMIDPDIYYHTAQLTPRVDEREVMVNALNLLQEGEGVLRDRVLNKRYRVNISSLFDVSRMADLRNFYPNRFELAYPRRIPQRKTGLGGILFNTERWAESFHWNYNYSKYIGWPDPTFGGFLPNVSGDKGEDDMYLHLLNIAALPEIPYAGMWLSMFYAY